MSYLYNWNFGDGTYSNEPNPSHVFNYPGKYTITLTIYDTDDSIKNSVIKNFYIYVYTTENIVRKTNKSFTFGLYDEYKQDQE